MELAGLVIAYATLQFSLVGGLWKLRNHLDGQFQELRESVSEVKLVQAEDRAKYEGEWKLVYSAIDGNRQTIDSRTAALQAQNRDLERRINLIEKKVFQDG